MDPFTERMIKRAHMRPILEESEENSFPKSNEKISMEKAIKTENDSNKTSQDISEDKYSITSSYLSLPIRSPKNFKLSDATLEKSKKFYHGNGNNVEYKENVAMTKRAIELEKLKKSFLNFPEKETIPLSPQNSNSPLSSTCIPEKISRPKDDFIIAAKPFQGSHDSNLSVLTTESKEKNKYHIQINEWKLAIKKNQEGTIKKNDQNFKHTTYYPKQLSYSLPKIGYNNERLDQSYYSKSDFNFEKVVPVPPMDKKVNATIKTGLQETHFDFVGDVQASTKTEYDFQLEKIEEIKDVNKTFNSTRKKFLSNSTNINENVKKDNREEFNKVNLEDLDDMEDHVGQLDEINVSELKVEELILPDIKRAQIMTEVLPLSYIQELHEPDNSVKSSYHNLENLKEQIKLKNVQQKEMTPTKKANKSVLKTKEDLEIKVRKTPPPLCELNKKSSCHKENSIIPTTMKKLEDNSTSSQNDSLLVNVPERNSEATGLEDYNESTDISIDNLSLPSNGISFSCSSSTLISDSSFSPKIHSGSSTFLALQNPSFNKKNKNHAFQSTFTRNDDTTGNVDSARHCYNDSDQMYKTVFSQEESEIVQLNIKLSKESIIMEQASKAVAHCYSSPAFSDSPELVEGERLLLMSSIRRQAIFDEIRHLELQTINCSEVAESIEVRLEEINLYLRDEFFHLLSKSKQIFSYYIVCLLSHGKAVLCTKAVKADKSQPLIQYLPKNFKIERKRCDDLQISFRVYALQLLQLGIEKGKKKRFQRKASEGCTKKEVSNKCDPRCLVSCGLINSQSSSSNLTNTAIKENIISIPSFVLIADTVLHLPEDLQKESFVLQQYETFCDNGTHFNILQETANLKIICTLKQLSCDIIIGRSISKQLEGFLTRFSIIGGFGAWQREWWCIKGTYLLSWKYPEDEECLPPLHVMDLKMCTEKVLPVSQIKCARNNTFLIKMKAERNIQDSISSPVQLSSGGCSFLGSKTEHILSADTREERDDWCTKLNSILMSLQLWNFIPYMTIRNEEKK